MASRCLKDMNPRGYECAKAVSGHLAKMSRELLMHPLLSFATEANIQSKMLILDLSTSLGVDYYILCTIYI